MQTLRHIDLFSGIGGFALAAERVWPNIEHTFCDNEPFAQEVLKEHWPKARVYGDIKTLRSAGAADIVTGGFPCQPFSSAGKRRGNKDDRHLWPEMLRVIRDASPTWVIAENVTGIITLELDQVLSDLEGNGYSCRAFIIPACALNAPHRRDRVWIVAHADSKRQQGTSAAPDTSRSGGAEAVRGDPWSRDRLEVAAELCRVVHGVPARLDKAKRIHALGNAICPQIAEEIMRAIKTTNTI